jgi:hypothetical protein
MAATAVLLVEVVVQVAAVVQSHLVNLAALKVEAAVELLDKDLQVALEELIIMQKVVVVVEQVAHLLLFLLQVIIMEHLDQQPQHFQLGQVQLQLA